MPLGSTGRICPRCAAAFLKAAPTEMPGDPTGPPRAFAPPSVAELAPLFPQLEILELIGQGGMGAVYKARQKELDRIVALKILPPGIGDAAFAERFAREAKALARLNHPGIVTIFEFGRSNGLFFFLMEFVDGATLRQVLRGGPISPREALAIVPAICDALQYAHDQGIVHRDIKPENILLDRRGRTKVADFGLAKLMEGGGGVPDFEASAHVESSTVTHAGKVLGTPQYMAPEQCEHPATVDRRADIYALGVVFYQMLTGELPSQPIEPPSKKVHIDVRLDEVVLRALEKNPDLRYAQASALKTEVETIAATEALPGAASPRLAQSGAELTKPDLFTPANWLLGVALLNLVVVMTLSIQGYEFSIWNGRPKRIMDFVRMDFFTGVFYGLLRPFSAVVALVAVLGAWRMRTYRDLTLGKVATAICMMFPPGLVVGLPMGLGLWRQINSSPVRTAFENRARQEKSGTWPGDPLTPWAARMGMLATVCIGVILLIITGISPPDGKLDSGGGRWVTVLLVFLVPLGVAALVSPIAGWLAWDGLGDAGYKTGTIRNAVIAAMFFTLVEAGVPPTPVSAPPAWAFFQSTPGIGRFVYVLICFWFVWLLAVTAEKHRARLFARDFRLRQCLGWTTPLLITFNCALAAWYLVAPTIVPSPVNQVSATAARKGPVNQVTATTARIGDIGVILNSLGTVESSNSVMFSISEDYCQEVIRKFDAHQALPVDAENQQGQRFGHGFLTGVDNLIDTTTGTLKCRANLVPEGENLMVPGLFLNIRLVLEVRHGVTIIPVEAIQHDPQSAFVWVILSDHTVSRRPVRVGAVDGKMVEVQSGLSPGGMVVSSGFNGLREGRKVRYVF
jgi:serine/threonine protein kinase